MQNVSLQYIYNLSSRLKPLSSLPREETVRLSDVWFSLFSGQQALYELYGPNSLYGPYLRSSTPLADALLVEINPLMDNQDFDHELQPFSLFGVSHAFERFETVFLAELHSLTTFFVTKKGPYDIYGLLNKGEELIQRRCLAWVKRMH